MSDPIKTWQRPLLNVIVRGKPEEVALQTCKGWNPQTPSIRFGDDCRTDPDCAGCIGVAIS